MLSPCEACKGRIGRKRSDPATRGVSMGLPQRRVSIVAVPESMVAPVTGLYEGLTAIGRVVAVDDAAPSAPPFAVDIVGPGPTVTCRANGLAIGTHRRFDEVDDSDIVIAPSMMVDGPEWRTGHNDVAVEWMRALHGRGARLCGACSGALLLAETGLLEGREATVHPAFADTFRENFPGVRLRPESVLVATGRRGELVTSGAASVWHDLLLHIVSHHVGPAVAQSLARFMLIESHDDGQGPEMTFSPSVEHGDAAVRRTQDWLRTHHAGAAVLEDMQRVSGLGERSFKRRFKAATGYAPIRYLQHVRIEAARRRLERTDAAIDEIGCTVGYQNAAFFRRLFKRLTGVTPAVYRRRFRMPDPVATRREPEGPASTGRATSAEAT